MSKNYGFIIETPTYDTFWNPCHHESALQLFLRCFKSFEQSTMYFILSIMISIRLRICFFSVPASVNVFSQVMHLYF